MTSVDRVIQCPYCRRASTASLYVSKDGEIRLDHDCPACGHRGLGGADVLAGALRYEAAASLAMSSAEAGFVDVAISDLLHATDIEPMYRTPDGTWYGLGSKCVLVVVPTPEGECDLFDPRYDHIGDLSAREARDLDDPGYCSEEAGE